MTRALAVRGAHVALIVAGLVICLYPFTFGSSTTLTCRGVAMAPGSMCMKADGSAGQSYEQRLATRRSARPVIVGVGVLVTAFGAVLLAGDVRRRNATGSPVEDAR